jgi:hypothetical protein
VEFDPDFDLDFDFDFDPDEIESQEASSTCGPCPKLFFGDNHQRIWRSHADTQQQFSFWFLGGAIHSAEQTCSAQFFLWFQVSGVSSIRTATET